MKDLMLTEALVEAHNRAIVAVMNAMPGADEDQADEVVTAITSLVFETLKQYLPGEDTCN